MAKAFSLAKENFSLDLPKSRKHQTHKTCSDGGGAAEDALRDSAGHCPYCPKPTLQIAVGDKFLLSSTLEFQISRKMCVQM